MHDGDLLHYFPMHEPAKLREMFKNGGPDEIVGALSALEESNAGE